MTIKTACAMRCKILSLALGWILIAAASAAKTPPDADALAQRFRPYMKFSFDKNSQEPIPPAPWPWYFAASELIRDNQVLLDSRQLLEHPERVLEFADVRALGSNPRIADAKLVKRVGLPNGEPWDRVIAGGLGIYAHVTEIDARYVNIEYWTLYASNKGTVFPSETDHRGDLTAIHVVFDRFLDSLVRVGFGIHGLAIEIFELRGAAVAPSQLTGVDPAGNPVAVSAARYQVGQHRQFQQGRLFEFVMPSDPVVFLVHDPVTGRADHPAVFIEWGAHEPWPNPTGSVTAAPKHTGDGISFLPGRVDLLGPEDDPFRFFGGNFGDPVGLMRHPFWMPTETSVPSSFLAEEPNPYQDLGPLMWPPSRYRTGLLGRSAEFPFRDDVCSYGHITNVIVYHDEFIEGINMIFSNGGDVGGRFRGSRRGTVSGFTLPTDEFITGMSGTASNRITSLDFSTNKGNHYAFGGGGGTGLVMALPPDGQVCGFIGTEGEFLNSLGLLYRLGF